MSDTQDTNITVGSDEQNMNVEAALEKLEEINARLSDGKVSLNESIELYKEGMHLAELCRQNLEGIETEIKVLSGDEE